MTVRAVHPSFVEVYLPDTPVGELRLTLPCAAGAMVDPVAMSAVESGVAQIAKASGDAVGRAVAGDSKICSRCARTLMRAAMGSQVDRQAVAAAASGRPLRPGDDMRYAVADRALSKQIVAAKLAMEALSVQLATGNTAPLVEQVCATASDGNRWAPLYQATGAGWPMKVGQWQDYKACACGSPAKGESPTPLSDVDPMENLPLVSASSGKSK